MNKAFIILLNAFCIGVGLACGLAGSGFMKLPILIAVTVSALFFNKIKANELIFGFGIFSKSRDRWLWRLFLLFIFYYLIRQFIENTTLANHNSSPLAWAALVMLQNTLLFLLFAAVLILSTRFSYPDSVLALLIGFGIYAGLNLLVDIISPGPSSEFGESRFEGLVRWFPPLVRSNGTFSELCMVCFGLSLHVIKRWKLRGWCLLSIAGSMLFDLICAIKVQERAEVIPLLVAMLMLNIKTFATIRLIIISIFSISVIFALTFIGGLGTSIIRALPLEQVLSLVGSKATGVENLSGRTDIYEYGWSRLADPKVFLMGEGPVLRDACPAFSFVQIDNAIEYRMAYHLTVLNSLIEHGVIIGAFLLMLLLYLGTLSVDFKRNYDFHKRMMNREDFTVPGIMVVLWFSMSIINGPLCAFEQIVFYALVLFGALAWRGKFEASAPDWKSRGANLIFKDKGIIKIVRRWIPGIGWSHFSR